MFRFANMLVLKITKDCNLRCNYCYVRNKDDYKDEKIDFELYKKIIDKIVEDKLKSESNERKFSLVLHGGEPLIVGKELLSKMLCYARDQFFNNNIKYDFGIQTNLTLLDEEIALILGKHGVQVGVSFDGIKKGNEGRTKVLGQKIFEEKFKILKKYNVEFGFLMVVNSSNIKYIKQSTDYLHKHYNIEGVKINYSEDVNNLGGEVSGEDFFKYAWKPYIDEFIKTGRCAESNLENLIDLFITFSLSETNNSMKTNCGSKICAGGLNIIEIEPDGNIYFCGRYAENYEEAFMTHITYYDFLALKQIKRHSDFVIEKHKALLETHCDLCYADSICDHGCMAFHMSKYGKYGIRTDLVCPIFKNLYKYLVSKELDILTAFYNKSKDEKGNINFQTKDEIIKIKENYPTIKKFIKKFDVSIELDRKNSQTIKITKVKRKK